MSFLQAILVPEAMHVVGKETVTSDLHFGHLTKLSICFFNGSLSSVSLVDGGKDLLLFPAGSADGVVVVVVMEEMVVSPVLPTSLNKARGRLGVGSSLFLLYDNETPLARLEHRVAPARLKPLDVAILLLSSEDEGFQ